MSVKNNNMILNECTTLFIINFNRDNKLVWIMMTNTFYLF